MKNYARFLLELLCPLAFVVALVLSDNDYNRTVTQVNRSHLNVDGNVMVLPAEREYAIAGHSSFIMESQALSRERLKTRTK